MQDFIGKMSQFLNCMQDFSRKMMPISELYAGFEREMRPMLKKLDLLPAAKCPGYEYDDWGRVHIYGINLGLAKNIKKLKKIKI